MQISDVPRRLARSRSFKIIAAVFAALCIVAGFVFFQLYDRYSRMIDQRLNGQVFQNTAKIYDGSSSLVTTLSGHDRDKRRLVEFEDIPRVLVDAVTAGEDQEFFNHYGLDPRRIVAAFLWNLDDEHSLQGASTITQQLARSFFLTREPTMRRKLSEALIAVLLELRLSKEQIFTMYANEVYLGERGSYAIHGFGEAAAALFGKDLRDLSLDETATLAGIIPAPNAYSPAKHPERALYRRNLILKAMRQRGFISEDDYRNAQQAKLEVLQTPTDMTEAPYFIDFAREELLKEYSEESLLTGGLSVYTTLDLDLQRAAVEAVANGLAAVEKQLAAREKRTKHANAVDSASAPRPQAGLIALDPVTGEIKAMVGGSDYLSSQYNRITHAFRQPGSVFKPFVYAAALETAYDVDVRSAWELASIANAGALDTPDDVALQSIRDSVITPVTTIVDEPRAFLYGGAAYQPGNFRNDYRGVVTLRGALQSSLNSAAIQVAEKIGYDRVATMARRLGLNSRIKGYPSLALGAFEVTPIELAGAYTAFANQGRRAEPHVIRRVEAAGGWNLRNYNYPAQYVLRPEVAYVMTHLMEGVINHGTAARVRARGFKWPAAGKTGTSRDGWFAGYTKDLLVVAWVGYDDNRDLDLEGSRSALPIWTEFMSKAYTLRPPRQRMSFEAPEGVEMVRVDAESLLRATPDCTHTYEEAFIAGTAPAAYCTAHAPQMVIDAAADILRAKPSGVE